ncbi:MAG: DUF3598 family protein [Myxacorys californica WJT36-NPBG1]|jgi:hypothetical protein|nr:DUF3598 family protein [Myxacorys californica WJT36-NPBG1]
MKSQWECFLQNVGEWHGSFTSLSRQGEALEDIPSVVIIEQTQPQQVHFTLHRDSPNHQDIELDLRGSFGRDALFFETGAFSLGSMQLSPFGKFGCEFGLMEIDPSELRGANRRLRLVQLFENQALHTLTLICEQRAGTNAPERPPLTVDDLIGEWQGEAVTLYPDWRSPDSYSTALTIQREGDRLKQKLRFGEGDAGHTIASTAAIKGSTLLFDQSTTPIQILLLPDGASCNCPLQIKPGQPFVLELGWLLRLNLRQRIVRSYDSKGEWTSLTLVTEHKQ